jgi:hypothetical protein
MYTRRAEVEMCSPKLITAAENSRGLWNRTQMLEETVKGGSNFEGLRNVGWEQVYVLSRIGIPDSCGNRIRRTH